MERWRGVLKVPLFSDSTFQYKVATSLYLAPPCIAVPSANVIFFNGDRVEATGNPVIERLSNIQNIADILVSKFGSSINAWVVEAPVFLGPFALYSDFIPSVNQLGEPKYYSPNGFPASTSINALLSNYLSEAKSVISGKEQQSFPTMVSESNSCPPKTIVIGFSKGGIVLNQLLTELAFVNFEDHPYSKSEQVNQIIPNSKQSLLNSISEVHYVDVGLNCPGAYLSERNVIEQISKRVIRFVIHGTPRQWCDNRRDWIKNEKNKLVQILECQAQKSGGKFEVRERFYFHDLPPNLQMHFEIIETMDVS